MMSLASPTTQTDCMPSTIWLRMWQWIIQTPGSVTRMRHAL